MSAGAMQRKTSNGAFGRNTSNGALRRNTASNTICCCGSLCALCPSAGDRTVTISSAITVCTGTCFVSGGNSFILTAPVTLTGTFTLHFFSGSSSNCTWTTGATVGSGVAGTFYTGSTVCTVIPPFGFSQTIDRINVQYQISSGLGTMGVQISLVTSGGQGAVVFIGTTPRVVGSCFPVLPINNNQTNCFTPGHGGTVTVT